MKISRVSEAVLYQAISRINREHYAENIAFNRFDRVSDTRFNVTLTVNSSKREGHRLGFCRKNDGTRRRLAKACWHVHGHFFEALFALSPNAVIYSFGKRITAEGGNWEDRNVSSAADPLMFSEACECDMANTPLPHFNKGGLFNQ